ncbi:UDPGP type 1 family protein [Ruminococcus sp. XPD3002]|uniref:UTP--glucose-1-phosphate uridylyltransferase n=1 Tax=Ruminococcus sp. XPD3002 TaxID=1452269 RepID=UPI0009179E1E|nr:UDP-N-acetylglucosamine/UDP-N-acetylgalactosaminediphosphorylase [Ruminococcus flavefaciens]
MKHKVSEMLNMLEQEHIVKHLKSLSEEEQLEMVSHIESLDFSVLNAGDSEEKRGKFEPLFATTLSDIAKNHERYTEAGLKAIREGKVGAVLLAGGQGSRLGFDHPKGMYNIGVNKELYIFECLINNLLDVVKEAGAWVPLFIMTSADNNKETREFFEEHNYFGYSSDNVWFFVQEQLPTVDTNGKLMLSGKGRIAMAPNGNGGWYASMAKTGMLKIVQNAHIEWLNVFAVDNVLQRIADPCFVGAVIESGKVSGAKVVAKADAEEKVGVLCLEDGRPSIVEYYEMTDEMLHSREADGTLSYNYGVILNYLFRVDKLNNTLSVKLPLHRAFKKLKYMTNEGEIITPTEPNAYKFETLALDMVKLQDDCLAYEVDRNKEFAPVKNKTGVDSVDTARELLKANGVEL